jgi:3-oxoacyl-[acyl-carrier protein] reductase
MEQNSGGAFAGRVALVTGCGRENGLGYEVVRELVGQGASVVMTDVEDKGVLNKDEPEGLRDEGVGLEALAARLADAGGRVEARRLDVAEIGSAADVVRATVERFGRLDILVNNAAAPQGEDRNPVEKAPDSAFRSLVDINLYGTFQLCREAIPVMRGNGYGRIVNISSMYARKGTPNSALYAMTKAGIIGLTQSMAMEVAPHGITANCVCPGFIYTSRVQSGMRRRGITDEATWLEQVGHIPVGRNALPDDIAAAVVFLASEPAGYVTAQSLTVDGGVLGF